MDSSEAVYQGLKSAGINFIVSVPCVNLGKILEIIDEDEDIIHVPVTREEEGLGICAGAYFGGKKNCYFNAELWSWQLCKCFRISLSAIFFANCNDNESQRN